MLRQGSAGSQTLSQADKKSLTRLKAVLQKVVLASGSRDRQSPDWHSL